MRLLVDISANGWGHLSQTAPITDLLRQRIPGLELVVRSGIASDVLKSRLGSDVACVHCDDGFGLVMASPFAVDREDTLRRYQAIHNEFDQRVGDIARLIKSLGSAAVLSNVSYLSIAAAQRAGVPAFAVSSLNWADVFAAYFGSTPETAAILAQIEQSYREADCFFRLLPGLPMASLQTTEVPAPIARVGRERARELRSLLGIDASAPLVLCAFSGQMPDEVPQFASDPGPLTIIGPAAWVPHAPRLVPSEDLGVPFADLIASADLVVSKPGYGIVAEIGCAGTPAILISRDDWPEQPHLLRWLGQHGRYVIAQDLASYGHADVINALSRVRSTPAPQRPEPGGELFVADAIAKTLAANGQRNSSKSGRPAANPANG